MLKHLLLIATLLLLSSSAAFACSIANADGSTPDAEDLHAMCEEGKYFDHNLCECVDGEDPEAIKLSEEQAPVPVCEDGRTKENTKCWPGYYFDETTCKCARYRIRQ